MRRTGQHGFTLLEVLAALAVLALALGATITGAAQYAANAGYLRDKAIATWIARNKLVELHVAPAWPEKGKSDGVSEMAGREWVWRTEVSDTPDPKVRRVEVLVEAPGKKDTVLVVLSGFLTPQPMVP